MNKDEIEWFGELLSEDPDNNNRDYEDIATKLRRLLVRNHGMEEYDIGIDAPDDQDIADTDNEIWKIRHNAWHKPFVLSIRRDVLACGEMKLMLDNVKEFLDLTDWKITETNVSNSEFNIKVSRK